MSLRPDVEGRVMPIKGVHDSSVAIAPLVFGEEA